MADDSRRGQVECEQISESTGLNEYEQIPESTGSSFISGAAEKVWYDTDSTRGYVPRCTEPSNISLATEEWEGRCWGNLPDPGQADRLPHFIVCFLVCTGVFSVIATPITLLCCLPGITELQKVRLRAHLRMRVRM